MKHSSHVTALAALAVLSSTCSVLFNPSKAPPRACPDGVAACPARANATVACEAAACRYTCAPDFVDVDGDPDNGCERSCAEDSAPANPDSLVATAGLQAGALRWTWPTAPMPVTGYRLCTGPAGGAEDTCRDVALTACVANTCTFDTTGLPDFVRVFGKVLSVNECLHTGSRSTAPAASASPINSQTTVGWTLDAQSSCNAQVLVSGDVMSLEQTQACTSTVLAGDDGWGSGTLNVDVRVSNLSQNVDLGVVVLANTLGHRVLATTSSVALAATDRPTNLRQRRIGGAVDAVVAASIRGVTPSDWQHLRLVNERGLFSLSVGADATSLIEVLRWPDPSPDAATRTGHLGFVVIGAGRAEFKGLVVTTAAVLPPRGPTRDSVSFTDGGFGPNVRTRMNGVSVLQCPVYAEGPGCDGGCSPVPGLSCLRVTRNFFTNPMVAFDLPVGVDVREPWRLSVRFAPTDAGALFPAIVAGQGRALINTANWTQPLSVFGQNTMAVVPAYTWNTAELRIDPDGGHFDLSVNGIPRPVANDSFPPAGWDRHLGSFGFGEGGGELYVFTAEISQP